MALTIGSGWTMGAGWTISDTAAVATDPYFMYNSLLLPGNGTNLAQNNTFLDGSTNNFAITRYGNTTQGTFSPYGANWSNYFDGTGDNLSVADNATLQFGTGNFTIELWFYPTSTISSQILVSKGTGSDGFEFRSRSSAGGNYFSFWAANGGTAIVESSVTLTLNTWQHLAVVRSSGTMTLYKNGVNVGSASDSTSFVASGSALKIAVDANTGAVYSTGYISNLRIVKGTAVYTGAFTPSSTPLTAIANTSLLTCQSNRFIDNSTNAFAITKAGDTSVQRFSPFEPTAEYSSSTIGGSGYFDGSGDYLSVASNALMYGPAFTLEGWFYYTAAGIADTILCSSTVGNGGLSVAYQTASAWGLASTGVGYRLTTTTLPTVNAWNHIVVGRSGTGTNQTSIWLNGTRVANGTVTDSFAVTSPFHVGWDTAAANKYFTGDVSDFRFVRSDVYGVSNTTITVPTAPLTAIANTSVLLNFTNGGVIDNAMMTNLETVGDAKISTTQSKFGGSSMSFDGSGDYLLGQTTQQTLTFGTGNFTVECWVYPVSYMSPVGGIVDSGSSVNGNRFSLVLYANGKIYVDNNTNLLISSTTISTGAWTHVAICRSNGTMTMYFNGTSVGSVASSTNFSETYNRIGSTIDGYSFNGYIDDLRITRGLARYTSNFTAPTSAFPLY